MAEVQFYQPLIEQLTRHRKAKGLSQEAVSQLMGVSDGVVAKWESGHRMPSSFFLMCWCNTLKLEVQCRSLD